MIVWHYTTRLTEIEATGEIRPGLDWLVWFTSDSEWGRGASSFPDPSLPVIYRPRYRGNDAYRIGVDSELLKPWRIAVAALNTFEFLETAIGLATRLAEVTCRATHYASVAPVPRPHWQSVEQWNGVSWVDAPIVWSRPELIPATAN